MLLQCCSTGINDAAEMFSDDSAKHLFGIYMLFVIMLYLCIQW